jgi:hypothetical protein
MADTETTTSGKKGGKQTVRGYWVKLLNAHPAWLTGRSNEKLFEQYLKDHPGEKEVPQKAKQGLSTVKSIMRKERKTRKKGRTAGAAHDSAPATTAPRKTRSTPALEQLEERLDDVLALAKSLDNEKLDRVIHNLRTARNAVVVLLSEA